MNQAIALIVNLGITICGATDVLSMQKLVWIGLAE